MYGNIIIISLILVNKQVWIEREVEPRCCTPAIWHVICMLIHWAGSITPQNCHLLIKLLALPWLGACCPLVFNKNFIQKDMVEWKYLFWQDYLHHFDCFKSHVLKIHVFLNTAKIWWWCPISWQEKNHFKRRPKHITNKMSHWTLRWRWQWAIWDTIRRINKTPQNKNQTNSPNHPKSKSKCSL